jgi:hypothetical protein
MNTIRVWDYLQTVLADCWTEDEQPEAVRLAAAVEYGCWKTLLDIGMLDKAVRMGSIDYVLEGEYTIRKIERTDIKCIDLMYRMLAQGKHIRDNKDAVLLMTV